MRHIGRRAVSTLVLLGVVVALWASPASAETRPPHQGCDTWVADGFAFAESWQVWDATMPGSGGAGYVGGSFRISADCDHVTYRSRGLRRATTACVQMRLALIESGGSTRYTTWQTSCPNPKTGPRSS